jgi:hypothetical protein
MTTKKDTPQGRFASLPVEHMPPLNVTTDGIPAREHVDAVELPSTDSGARRAAWAIVVASILVIVAAVTALVVSGLNTSSAAGFEYRPSGERGSVAVWHVNHVG